MLRKKLRRPFHRPVLRKWVELASYFGVILGILLILSVIYLELFAPEALQPSLEEQAPPASELSANATQDAPPPAKEEASAERQEPAEPSADASPAEEDSGEYQGVVKPGTTAGTLLQQWLSPSEIQSLGEACKKVFPLTKLRAGHSYTAFVENGRLFYFEYEVDKEQVLSISRMAPEKEGGEDWWSARLEPIAYEVRLDKVEGVIEGTFFDSMVKAGERPALAVRLAEIFAWEINFIRDIQPGDSFRILIEKRFRNGEERAYGAIPAAEFINRGSKYEAYRYVDSFGAAAYFNAAGDSLKRAFLKAPLSFTRISSHYSMARMHPILATVRAHPAVDYSAPSGTPVMAIGSGTVTYRGWGQGAGNYISLRHANGYESMYLHLSGFAKTLKQGGRVRQGDIIGFVGSTGYSTGPHLDFRMKKNGQFLNPEKVLSPRDEAIPKKQLPAFKAKRDRMRAFLEEKLPLRDHTPEKD